jgi:hypothetical protein
MYGITLLCDYASFVPQLQVSTSINQVKLSQVLPVPLRVFLTTVVDRCPLLARHFVEFVTVP